MKESQIFNVYRQGKQLYTKSITPKLRVYDERLKKDETGEYRSWDPHKSKLAAAIMQGARNIYIRKNDYVLYLGSSTGTTASHVSDLIGEEGLLYGIDPAPRVMREFVFLCEKRKNMIPILADANKPETFAKRITQVDIIYQDIAQKHQVEILEKNMQFLKKGGYALLFVKARSIDVTKKPSVIFKMLRKKVSEIGEIIDFRTLDPYEKDHCLYAIKKR
jgi:fibrillarin-like pre-rRNA processing protein